MSDLAAIWLHISADSPSAADRVLDAIDRACQTLAEFPSMGRGRDDLGSDLRNLPVGN